MPELLFPENPTLHTEQDHGSGSGGSNNNEESWSPLVPVFENPQINFSIRVVALGSHPVDGIIAVCKVAYGQPQVDRLTKEATFYNTQLSAIQGQGVPKLYGFFQGETGRGLTAVLLMDDCGVALTRPLWQYPLDFRTKVMDVLHDIHKAGIQHNDFSERNIVIMKQEADGEFWPTIVDFGNSQEHRCRFAEETIPINCRMPLGNKFGCFELWNAGRVADIWKPGYIQWFEGAVPAEWATTPEELVEKAKWPEDISRERVLRLAREEIEELECMRAERDKYLNIPITWH
ncbi:hypothetical protein C8Q76DRAFT_860972 [Earliella scabrosa]|nr:hypothetical protein C8Q76DRAFT_860972 [Earliella scabrosa]